MREAIRPGSILRLVVVLALLVAGALPAPAAARYATPPDVGLRLTVCAESLGVYQQYGGHGLIGVLSYPQTFTVHSLEGSAYQWVYGRAWGNVNAYGYVRNGWFC